MKCDFVPLSPPTSLTDDVFEHRRLRTCIGAGDEFFLRETGENKRFIGYSHRVILLACIVAPLNPQKRADADVMSTTSYLGFTTCTQDSR